MMKTTTEYRHIEWLVLKKDNNIQMGFKYSENVKDNIALTLEIKPTNNFI